MSVGDPLTHCDREPIHIPGTIQSHGFLIAADALTGVITHASDNLPGGRAAAVIGRPLADFFGAEMAAALGTVSTEDAFVARPASVHPGWRAAANGQAYQLIAHRRNGFVIIEGEELAASEDGSRPVGQQTLEPLLIRLSDARSIEAMHRIVVEELRQITQFDRVLLYRFDQDWHGEVIAESRNDQLPAYLGHHFPADDIPQPARDLYLHSRLRMIASADAPPVRVLAASASLPPLDLTLSVLRGVSPIHIEYMRNMGTGCSMSVAVMRHGRLWGLLSCHSRDPRRVPFEKRVLCMLASDLVSLQLQVAEQARRLAYGAELRVCLASLLSRMTAAGDFLVALADPGLLALTAADGVAFVWAGSDAKVNGKVPDQASLRRLAEWLAPRCVDGLYSTDAFPTEFAPDSAPGTLPGGLLAIAISPADRSYLCWFRQEVAKTVLWGGDPHKHITFDTGSMRVHPRLSFESWKETMRGRAAPWQAPEIDAALALRLSIVDIVLRQSAEKQRLLEELQRATRENKELEAFTYTVSHDLRAPFRHVRSYAELLKLEKNDRLDDEARGFIDNILDAAKYAGQLVDSMLAFSRMSMQALELQRVDLNDLVATCRREAMSQYGQGRSIEWQVGTLPVVQGDRSLLRSAVQNLIDNAVKYTSKRTLTRIEISSEVAAGEHVVKVRDNGAGFDMKFVNKLFGVFQRLHTSAHFPGLGIGLASVQRIIHRHGGRVWAEGQLDVGATFSFSLPRFAGS